jgi:hypothetical protein
MTDAVVNVARLVGGKVTQLLVTFAAFTRSVHKFHSKK